ncbi:GmrSD restriction endonuclease domain-containing protein [Streptomyces kebangsaanensis]|uniref:GmrSD restriction endonuclease domain-containing protein n=1 Tax=Streptomyces kebangsaanensis TaxID=864058 RepID=UPI00093E7E0E|nr:DUF262 domain-containing protein [Streptomyces kebangsaanensis]
MSPLRKLSSLVVLCLELSEPSEESRSTGFIHDVFTVETRTPGRRVGPVRAGLQSLYRGYPIGRFLTWSTKVESVSTRGGSPEKDGTVQMLLDGQQRVTTLYGVMRGRSPRFSRAVRQL